MSTKDQTDLPGRDLMPSLDFVLLAETWCRDQSAILLGFVWQAYDQMRRDNPSVDGRDLERSITQLLAPRIHRAMSGDEPFYVLHGPSEREKMEASPAQPPENDVAFILWEDERIMWPLEAKVLENAVAVSEYARAIRNNYLKFRYAPFSSEGAMLGYLLSGTPGDTFQNISTKVPCELKNHPSFPSRPQKLSRHVRSVPIGKAYPATFHCHHLILEFPDLKRSRR